jgi:hypothetical protein
MSEGFHTKHSVGNLGDECLSVRRGIKPRTAFKGVLASQKTPQPTVYSTIL